MIVREHYCCPALSEIEVMKTAALTWDDLGQRRVRSRSMVRECSLLFQIYGRNCHNSMNNLHMHVVDLDFV